MVTGNFEEIRKKASRKWNLLKSSKVPVIYLGMASCGMAAGALEVLESIEKTLKKKRLKARIVQVGCIGPCYLEPLMDITMPGHPRVSYANVSPERAREVVESYLVKGDPKTNLAIGHFGEEGDESTEGIPRFFDLPMLKDQVRVVLRNCGFIEPGEIDQYIANDGYTGMMNALRMEPDDVIGEIRDAGLRGRGGAGFPTYRKWEICRDSPGNTRYMICNADEGAPGAFMNWSLL